MKIGTHELETSLPDSSAAEFAEALLNELRTGRDSVNEMWTSHNQGRQHMLNEIIEYLEKVKP